MIATPLVRREIRDAMRQYWFLANAGAFVVAGVLFMVFGHGESMVIGSRGYARALAGLAQLALVFVPLMALMPAVAAIAGERATGTLDYLLAQPVTRDEVFTGKWIGIAAAAVGSVVVGLALTAAVAAARGVPTLPIAAMIGCTVLLAAAFVSVGLWVSTWASSPGRATSVGLTIWLALLGLGSLGVMSAFVQWGLPAPALQAWALIDPVEAYRLATIAILDPEAAVLGPVGESLLDTFGREGFVALAIGSLAAWSAGGFALGLRTFSGATVRAGSADPGSGR